MGDLRVLNAIDKPQTTAEITARLRREVWETWAEQEGIEIVWNECGLPAGLGMRLLAYSTARERGLVTLNSQQVYNRLRKLERFGAVARLSMPEHSRTILWYRRSAERVVPRGQT